MRLIELELTNIKTYKEEKIVFSEGINCILGLNGSGKSTIIESIGNVLFNYNQRTNNELLRYNEKKGMISLLFEGNDNKLYRINKTIRPKAATIKIIDCENNQVLQETISDVYVFVKKVLNIPKEKNLPKLFEEIIAVPQGTFVNAFLETSKSRKENFDKLFELDIYKELADKVKLLNDKVEKEYIRILENKISELNGKLVNYNILTEELEIINKEIIENKNNLESINNIYNKKVEQKNTLSKQKELILEKQEQKNAIILQFQILKQKIEETTKQLNESIKAKEIINENEFAYNLYKENNNKLIHNQMLYNSHISDQERLFKLKEELLSLEEKNKSLLELIKKNNIDLGYNKQTILDKQQDNITKNKEIIEKEIKLKEIIDRLDILIKEIDNIKEKYALYINKLNIISEYLLVYNKDINISKIDEHIAILNNKLDIINQNKEIINELEKEKIKLEKDLENLKTNQTFMNDGMCPILKQKCLNIKGSDLTIEIDHMIEEIVSKIKENNIKISNLNTNIKEEEQLIKEKQVLEVNKNNYIIDYEKYILMIEDIKQTFPEVTEINEENDVHIVSQLIRKYTTLKDNYINEEYNKLKDLELILRNEIHSNKTVIAINEQAIEDIINKNNLLIIDNDKNQKLIDENTANIVELNKQISGISETIKEIPLIKEIIDECSAVIEKYKSNYELYISKVEESLKYESLLELSKKLDKDNKDLSDKLLEIEKQIEEITKGYSQEEYENLEKDINDLSNKISIILTTITLKTERYERLNKEINVLNALITEKSNYEKKLVKYQELSAKYIIIRDVLANLPRVLSEQIRKYISTYSSGLYRQISNENVRINIKDDYEVVLIDCSDESKIKSLTQLSGGEQMSVAIAIRLAMLKQITGIEFYFMDEPTINLDYERRMKVADVVKDMAKELKQLFVISHDDTFESITDNTIKIIKQNNISELEN